jgi:Translation elongation factor Ts
LVGLNKAAAEAGKDIAMQIAALNPVAVDAASVPADVIAREKSIIVELMKQDPKMAGKPDEMLTKIAEGKMGAFFKEQTLTAQAFVKDTSKTVADYLKESGDVKVTEFKRVALG